MEKPNAYDPRGTIDGWGKKRNKRELKRMYISLMPMIQKTARACGYAVGVHGSLTRDLDIMAVPWVEKYVQPEILAIKIQFAVTGASYRRNDMLKMETKKPHGRVAYSIPLGVNAYIDLSVITNKTCKNQK